MLRVEYTSQFKRDFKKVTRMSIEDILVVGHVISQLQQNEPLSAKFVDHPSLQASAECKPEGAGAEEAGEEEDDKAEEVLLTIVAVMAHAVMVDCEQ